MEIVYKVNYRPPTTDPRLVYFRTNSARDIFSLHADLMRISRGSRDATFPTDSRRDILHPSGFIWCIRGDPFWIAKRGSHETAGNWHNPSLERKTWPGVLSKKITKIKITHTHTTAFDAHFLLVVLLEYNSCYCSSFFARALFTTVVNYSRLLLGLLLGFTFKRLHKLFRLLKLN